ncbi:MAG: NAD(P)H-hydrate dehydratase [Nevskiales bacterium]
MQGLPAALYRTAQVRELDRRAIEDQRISSFELMQRAADATFGELRRRWPQARRIQVLCGSGNNGGDGLLLAVRAEGMETEVSLVSKLEELKGDAALALTTYQERGGVLRAYAGKALPQVDVVVDALLGTGLTRPVEGLYKVAIDAINAARLQGAGVLAMDIPSGLSADTGIPLGAAVTADLTVSFIGLKLGLFIGEGPDFCGDVVFHDLAVPHAIYDNLPPAAHCLTDSLRAAWLRARKRTAHKSAHGHVLCVGGDYGMGGAIRLAAEAALRCGSGLVSVATRPRHAVAMVQARPELMARGVGAPGGILASLLARAKVLVLGPGLGQGEWGRALFMQALDFTGRVVLDADGLNLLAHNPLRRDDWVLTPHPGEAARLLGISVAEVQSDRPAAVNALLARYGGVVILKGAGTLGQASGGALYVNTGGNPGMAAGGMGDVLSGVIGALLAQGLRPEDAARLGVYLHARAGDLAANAGGERGLIPSDLLPFLRQLVNP